MELIKLIGIAVLLTSCGLEGLTGTPSNTNRGEADAINPARNVTVTCEDKNPNVGITVNITNNCNKNNAVADPTVVEPTVVQVPAPIVVTP